MNKIALLIVLFLGLATDGFGATLRNRFVNPGSSGGDGTTSALSGANAAYASLSAAEAAEDDSGDIVTSDEYVIFNCAGTTADTSLPNFDGWNTGITTYIEAIGDYAVTSGGQYSTSYYRIEAAPLSGGGSLFDIREAYVRVSKIQIKIDDTTLNGFCFGVKPSTTTSDIRIENCVMQLPGNQLATTGVRVTTDSTTLVRNCLIYNTGSVNSHGVYQNAGTGTITSQNVTVYGFDDGFERDTGTVVVTNCVAIGCTDGYDGVMTSTTSWSDVVGDGNSQTTQTDAQLFVSVAGGDFHLVSGADLIDVGTDLSASFTIDLDGVTRGATWDIGADEFVAAGGTRRVIFIQ